MKDIIIFELGEMLVDSKGAALNVSVQIVDSSDQRKDDKSKCNSSCGNCCSSRTNTSSPELNITAVSPSPPFLQMTVEPPETLTASHDIRADFWQPISKCARVSHTPITNRTVANEVAGSGGVPPPPTPSIESAGIGNFAADLLRLNFLKKANTASYLTQSSFQYLTDLLTPPITPSTAGTSSSSGSSGSSTAQYPATPHSIIPTNPFFPNNLFTNYQQMMNRQLSAPAKLATPAMDEHSSPSIIVPDFTKLSNCASADEAGSPTSVGGPPNRKRSQNLVHAAQYRDRRRQKIEQLYAEKDREEAKVCEQKNVIQNLCSQIEKLIETQTRASGEDSNTYRCPICTQSFPQLGAIRVHLNTAHPERTCSSGPLSKAVVDPVSGQLHLRPPFRHSESEQQVIKDWIDAQRIAQDNFFHSVSNQVSNKKQQQNSHSQSFSMIMS